jgi:hypothetical protein
LRDATLIWYGASFCWAGWRWVFFLNVPIGLAALVPARRLLREARDPEAVVPDLLGSVLRVVGVGALALGIVKGQEWGWDSARVLGSLGAASLLLPALGLDATPTTRASTSCPRCSRALGWD